MSITPHHQISHKPIDWTDKQPPRWDDSEQPVVAVGDIEVNDFLAHASFADVRQGRFNRHLGPKKWKIFARRGKHRLVQMRGEVFSQHGGM
jgi:hypothetical protein